MKDTTKARTCLPARLSIVHLLVVLVSLMVTDGMTSRAIVESGAGYEGNPFLFGLRGANWVLVKLAGGLLATVILADVHRTRPKAAEICALTSIMLYTGIVFWNAGILLFAR